MQVGKIIKSYNAILLFLASIAFFYALHTLQETPFANGWDAYFYLDQIKHWYANGELHTQRYSLYYPYLIIIQFFTDDYVQTYKIGIATCTATLTFVVGKLPQKLTNNKLLGIALAIYISTSLHITYFAANYAKNYLGIIFFFVLVYVLVSKKSILLQILLLVASLFIHKLTAVISLLALAVNYIHYIKFKTHQLIILFSGGILSIIGVIFFFIHKERQPDFITTKPTWHLYEFYKEMTNLHDVQHIELAVLFVLSVLIIVYGIFQKAKNNSIFYLSIILLLGINFPCMKWDIMGYSFRLFILLPFFFILLISSIPLPKGSNYMAIVAAGVLVFYNGYNPKKQDPPYLTYKRIVNTIQKADFKQ